MKSLLIQLKDVFVREFSLVKHDVGLIIFFLFLPLAYPVIYSLIYNPEVVRDVPVVVIDNDRTATSRKLVRMLDATQEARIIGYAADLPEARRAMAEQKCFGILEIPAGFDRKIGSMEQAQAVMYCDMTLLLRYRGLLVASTNVAAKIGSELTTERIDQTLPLAETVATGDLMPVNNIPMGNIESGFDSFIMPGVVILILQQVIILAVGMAGGAKRERPELIGYDPVNKSKSVVVTMLGQIMCYLVILAVPILFLVHFVPLIFRFPMAGDKFEILLFLVPMVIASCGVGFMLQGVIREREEIFVVWVITSVIFLFLSGLTWPRYAMAPVWRMLSDVVPATFGIEGFIRMNSNGASLSQVSGCYTALWIQSAVYMVLAWVVQKWVVRPAERKTLAARRAYLSSLSRKA